MEQTGLASLFPILLLFVLFYFLLIKPQQKKAQQQRQMLEDMKVGDKIVLTSGIICDVAEIPVNKEYVLVRLNQNNIVSVYKDAIMGKYEEKDTNGTKK